MFNMKKSSLLLNGLHKQQNTNIQVKGE